MASEIWVNIGSGNGLLPESTKPLPETILAYHQQGPLTITPAYMDYVYLNNQNSNPQDMSEIYTFKITATSPRGQWVNSCSAKLALCIANLGLNSSNSGISNLLNYMSLHYTRCNAFAFHMQMVIANISVDFTHSYVWLGISCLRVKSWNHQFIILRFNSERPGADANMVQNLHTAYT